MLEGLIRIPSSALGCEYSLIVLWPHTDERDGTAGRGEETKVTERHFRAVSDKGWGIPNCLPLIHLP